MSTLEDLEARLSRAIERITQGVDALAAGEDDPSLTEAQAALEDEKLANAQLQERLVTLSERADAAEADAKAHADRLENSSQTIARLDKELQQVLAANTQLRENNAALRSANEAGLGDPDLVNSSLSVELDALRAARSADRAELDAVLAELTPIVEGQV